MSWSQHSKNDGVKLVISKITARALISAITAPVSLHYFSRTRKLSTQLIIWTLVILSSFAVLSHKTFGLCHYNSTYCSFYPPCKRYSSMICSIYLLFLRLWQHGRHRPSLILFPLQIHASSMTTTNWENSMAFSLLSFFYAKESNLWFCDLDEQFQRTHAVII